MIADIKTLRCHFPFSLCYNWSLNNRLQKSLDHLLNNSVKFPSQLFEVQTFLSSSTFYRMTSSILWPHRGGLLFLKLLLYQPAFVATISFIWNILFPPFAYEHLCTCSNTSLTYCEHGSIALLIQPVLSPARRLSLKTELVFSLFQYDSEAYCFWCCTCALWPLGPWDSLLILHT